MLKAMVVASALALALALPARAATNAQPHATLIPSHQTLADEVVEVQTKPSPAGILARDAIGGAVLGTAVGGGVALYNRYVSDSKSWGDWQKDLAYGALIGLAAGLVFGAVDAASSADRAFVGPVADERRVGFGAPMANYGSKF